VTYLPDPKIRSNIGRHLQGTISQLSASLDTTCTRSTRSQTELCFRCGNVIKFRIDLRSLNLPMRSLLTLVLLSTTMSAYAQTTGVPDAIIEQENAFWKAYVNANTADLSKLFLPNQQRATSARQRFLLTESAVGSTITLSVSGSRRWPASPRTRLSGNGSLPRIWAT
jgi:hypothetical protein